MIKSKNRPGIRSRSNRVLEERPKISVEFYESDLGKDIDCDSERTSDKTKSLPDIIQEEMERAIKKLEDEKRDKKDKKDVGLEIFVSGSLEENVFKCEYRIGDRKYTFVVDPDQYRHDVTHNYQIPIAQLQDAVHNLNLKNAGVVNYFLRRKPKQVPFYLKIAQNRDH